MCLTCLRVLVRKVISPDYLTLLPQQSVTVVQWILHVTSRFLTAELPESYYQGLVLIYKVLLPFSYVEWIRWSQLQPVPLKLINLMKESLPRSRIRFLFTPTHQSIKGIIQVRKLHPVNMKIDLTVGEVVGVLAEAISTNKQS